MVKLLIIAVATLAIALAAPVEKRKVSIFDILGRRDPFPEPKSPQPASDHIRLLNITQRVDNFDPQNANTYEQRYYVNDEFYTPGSPIFLFLGGEWTITPYRMEYSLMHNMASEMNGSIFYLEHRYYGESRPTPNVTDENLKYLTPEQALADTAHFVHFIRRTVPGAASSDIILNGGHYSASLSIWFRQRYPHLTTGVWASSAPLPSIVDFSDFKAGVGRAYRAVGGDICYNFLEQGFDTMHEMVENGDFEELTDLFYLCDPLEPEDVGLFFSVMAEIYAFYPQFETPEYIRATCDLLVSEQGSVPSIAYILNAFIDVIGGQCINIDYDALVEADRETDWDAPSVVVGYRQWTYQLCTQVGWFHTSSSPDQPFGNTFPISVYMQGCEDIFGDAFTEERLEENSDRFNTLYGGLEPEVNNALFTHGEHDPWNVLGRRTDLNPDATAIIIEGATMGNDLGPRSPDNPEPLRLAKLQVEARIREWIDE